MDNFDIKLSMEGCTHIDKAMLIYKLLGVLSLDRYV